MNLPIYFKYLRVMWGWYYPETSKEKKGPLIEVNINLTIFQKIGTLVHEYVHFICDTMADFPIGNIKVTKSIEKDSNVKPVPLPILRKAEEEKLAEEIEDFVVEKFKQYYLK